MTCAPDVQSPGAPQAAATGLHWKMATGHEICHTIQHSAKSAHKEYVYSLPVPLATRSSVQIILDLMRAPSST